MNLELVSSKKDVYPDEKQLESEYSINYIPWSLRFFCSKIFVGEKVDVKIASIGQCIIQAARPRAVLAPLQIGIAIQMHHHFRSRFLIDTLHKFGFSSSYAEVQKFERNAAVLQGCDLKHLLNDNSQILCAADNVDHNVRTLDGNNTFHGMGMIASIKLPSKNSTKILRRTVTNQEILKASSINIVNYREAKDIVNILTFKQLDKTIFCVNSTDLLWKLSWYFNNPIPSWSGCMQLSYDKQAPVKFSKSTVAFLPIIDLSPSNMSCILSTLAFLSDLAKSSNKPCIVTFDQPLYWKASKIIHESTEPYIKAIVLMLGGFHTTMNFLGCIGVIMEKSGISSILEQVYGENAVIHMLTGKAYSRAVRGHFIVDAALNTVNCKQVLADDTKKDILQNLDDLYNQFLAGSIGVDELHKNENIQDLKQRMDQTKKQLSNESKTAELWFNYQSMVDILRNFIRSERIADWKLHLDVLRQSLPIFAASGNSYLIF